MLNEKLIPNVINRLNLLESKNIFSSKEQVIGVDEDGNTIYSKFYSVAMSEKNASFPLEIEGNYELILSLASLVNGGNLFPLPSIRNGYPDYQTEFYIFNRNVVINVVNADRTGYTVYLLLFYKKTTK